MAFKCTEKWDSWINPGVFPPSKPPDPNDGVITINAVLGGKFTGSHKDKAGNTHTKLKGDCEETPHHFISFTSEEDGVVHKYEGSIQEIKNKVWIRGTHTVLGDDKRKLNGNDDWVGTHTT